MNNDLPTFAQQVAVAKSTISDLDIFKDFIALQDLKIIEEESEYVIIEGDKANLQNFVNDWDFYIK